MRLLRWVKWLTVDLFFLILLSITALKSKAILSIVGDKIGIPINIGSTILIVVAVALIVPLFGGIIGITSRIAREIAETAFPVVKGLDSGHAPRMVLRRSLHIILTIIISIPIVIATEPIAPMGAVPSVIGITLIALGVSF